MQHTSKGTSPGQQLAAALKTSSKQVYNMYFRVVANMEKGQHQLGLAPVRSCRHAGNLLGRCLQFRASLTSMLQQSIFNNRSKVTVKVEQSPKG